MLYQSDQKAQEAFLTEISILKFASRDRNVVQFYGVSIRQNGIWLITEHMEVRFNSLLKPFELALALAACISVWIR